MRNLKAIVCRSISLNTLLSDVHTQTTGLIGGLVENRDIHQTVPDHRVKLTPDGWKQVALIHF